MEPTSNQADTVDTTAQTTVVKRLRRGDTREDGMMFWKYNPSYPDGEWWLTPEEFAAKQAKETKKKADLSAKKAALPTKLRRGDVREDGKIFWQYHPNRVNGEWWVSAEEFAAKQATKKAKQAEKQAELSAKKASLPTKLRRGDVREDGMIFWSYDSGCPNSEYWKTSEQFMADRAKTNARRRERYATDPLYVLKCRLRSRVSSALKAKGFRKNTKTALTLGCTYEELKAHTEARLPPGMTWETFLSDGHLDHIVPLDAADTEAEVYALNHFTNLRPLWGPENQSKNAKLPAEHELPADLHDEVRKIWQRAKDSACTK